MSAFNSSFTDITATVFDKRYVYFFDIVSGYIARYDITKPFTSSSSYTIFNAASVDSRISRPLSALYDSKQYIYISTTQTPYCWIRLNTITDFQTSSSYEVTTVATSCSYGLLFDGRYVYTASNSSGTILIRYDTTASFTSAGSYQTYNTSGVNANLANLLCSTYDGRYVYCVSYSNTYKYVLRYDTQSSFTSLSSYTNMDHATINANIIGYWGACYDGRYIYFFATKWIYNSI